MAKKEVKNPRKPATKKVSKAKATEKEAQEVVTTTTPEAIIENVDNEKNKFQDEGLIPEGPEETGDEELSKGDDKKLDPQEVITEFTEATKKLDEVMTSPNPEDVLKEELKKTEEVEEKLKEQIKKQEEKIYNPRGNSWNGVSDGWYDY